MFLASEKLPGELIIIILAGLLGYGIYCEIKKLKRKTPEFIINEQGLIYEDNNLPWGEINGDKFEQGKSGHWLSLKCNDNDYTVDVDELNSRIKEIKFAYYSYKLRYLQKAQKLQDEEIQDLARSLGGLHNSG